ncbi:RHS repeat-associated core domain-containing protein [Haloimpatiens lingqiaonensis]|uniref:RHS repeat-associated core domain-containing protein n=1 Tax=Haloimpatiens lingqiaonensis TaxID=1380675 RepID=UPI001FA96469|nr:RHS repeat-associated core domain-containing protein [Haloimpatiens lingqiaonensis]
MVPIVNFIFDKNRSITVGNHRIKFKYNDQGIRTEKTVNGVTTKYHLVGGSVTYEDNGKDKIHYTYDSSGKLISMNLNGAEYYYVRNAQGDIIGLINAQGEKVVSYTYDSWGELISIEGSLKDTVGEKNPYRYRGYRYDSETGLYYLQSRYYNPEWGRFINADGIFGVIGELLSKNMFAYCSNNPITRKDPSGFRHLRFDFEETDYVESSASGNGGLPLSDEISAGKDAYFARNTINSAHTVSNGTKAHIGKIRAWGQGLV